MATPMSACLSAGASLTPSPVTATTSPRAWSAATTRSFCAGVARAKITGPATTSRRSSSPIVSSSAPLTMRSDVSGDQPDPSRDALRGHAVVPGDHQDPDPGTVTGGDRGGHGLAGRVEHADHPEPGQVAFEHLVRGVAQLRVRPIGGRPRAPAARRGRARRCGRAGAARQASSSGRTAPSTRIVVHRSSSSAAPPSCTAAARRAVRCRVLIRLRPGSNGRSPTRGRSGLAAARSRPALPATTSSAASVGSPTTSHRSALVVGREQPGVAGEGPGAEELSSRSAVVRAGSPTVGTPELTLRPVARPGDLPALVGDDDGAHRHLVRRQGPGLVRADDRRGPEGLHRRQALDQGVPPGHPLGAHRQRQGDRGQQPSGTNATIMPRAKTSPRPRGRSVSSWASSEEQQPDGDRDRADDPAQGRELALERAQLPRRGPG
jgi:hypothetical protein